MWMVNCKNGRTHTGLKQQDYLVVDTLGPEPVLKMGE